ncbi:hypothetical protein D3C73_1304520 [compost metagenome]
MFLGKIRKQVIDVVADAHENLFGTELAARRPDGHACRTLAEAQRRCVPVKFDAGLLAEPFGQRCDGGAGVDAEVIP